MLTTSLERKTEEILVLSFLDTWKYFIHPRREVIDMLTINITHYWGFQGLKQNVFASPPPSSSVTMSTSWQWIQFKTNKQTNKNNRDHRNPSLVQPFSLYLDVVPAARLKHSLSRYTSERDTGHLHTQSRDNVLAKLTRCHLSVWTAQSFILRCLHEKTAII